MDHSGSPGSVLSRSWTPGLLRKRSVGILSSRHRGQTEIEGGAHTFWSWRSMPFSQTALSYLTAWDLGCVIGTLITIALFFTVLSRVTKEIHISYDTEAIVILKGTIRVHGSIVLFGKTEVKAFLGIPYAEQPLSNYRFRKPSPTFLPEDINATENPASCTQPTHPDSGVLTKEDCLTLNVWTPKADCDDPFGECQNKTVLLFLHGGFFQVGSNSAVDHDGLYLSALGNVVVVVPNYRLGALGFLNYGTDEAPGNAGLYDQLQAILWTKANIADFGGDPTRIVLLGHGAGASSVGYHLPAAIKEAGVQRAILMSGSPLVKYPDNKASARSKAEQLAGIFRCPLQPRTMLACLREVPASNLSDPTAYRESPMPLFFPTLQNFSLPSDMGRQVEQQDNPPTGMDILLGFVEDEGTLLVSAFLHYFKTSDADPDLLQCISSSLLEAVGFSKASAGLISNRYIEGFGGSRELWKEELVADIFVTCPVIYYAEHLASLGNNVFTYFVGRLRPSKTSFGVQHFYVIQMLFGYQFVYFRPREGHALSHQVIDIFTGFAKGQRSNRTRKILGDVYFLTIGPLQEASEESDGFYSRKDQCDFLKEHFMRQ
ncbi:acetylcholinesterase-1-like [Ornithodoros turicata]|uniref:acetylcholinesterase-1-like n=1 Tax=Ornithodoros turicata TaxID=34597 RepID=UPI003138D30C